MSDDARERLAGPRGPTCDRPVPRAGNHARPFCSVACKLIDLGNWLDGVYRVAGPPLSIAPLPTAPPASEDRVSG